MQKERLVLREASNLVTRIYKGRIVAVVWAAISVILMLLFFLITYSFEKEQEGFPLLSIAFFVSMVMAAGLVLKFCIELYKARDMLSGQFRLVTDELQNTEIRTKVRYRRRHYYPEDTYHLLFKCYGEFRVYNTVFYAGTRVEMGRTGVFTTAMPGDEFYLLISKTNEILMVYNKKFFEFKEEA